MGTTATRDRASTEEAEATGGAAATGRGRRPRLVGLDAFRGAVLAVMVLTPVTGEAGSYPHLGHAAWNGFTVADAILPAFLVASGASLAFLLRPPVGTERRWRLVRRTVALLVLGVVYNAWGHPWDLTDVRLTGVLQLIGVAGALAAVVVLAVRRLTAARWTIAAVVAGLATAHGAVLATSSPACTTEGSSCSPHMGIDVAVLGRARLYADGTAGYDPEGLVIAVVAACLVLIGWLAGEALREGIGWRPIVVVAAAGIALLVLGLALDVVQPINKRLHTPAFLAVAGGIGVLGIALLTALLDLTLPARLGRGARRALELLRRGLSHPLQTLGRNALVVFFTERLVLIALEQTSATTSAGRQPLREVLLGGWLPVDGVRVHLAYTGTVLLVVLAVAYAMRALRWRIAL